MDDYALHVEPFTFLFRKKLKEIVIETVSTIDEETAIKNILFFQEQKRKAFRGRDTFMVSYYLHALQSDHYPHHPLRPTFKRAQRLVHARDDALTVLALNASLLELQTTASEKEIPSSYLLTMDLSEFEEIETMEKPEEYALRDALLLDQYGINIRRRHI